jgi:hydroxymethylglutaryl-CoA lyase
VLQVDIREVGPRDGLQAEAPIAISDRVSLINQLISAGVRHIEVASFMRDDVVPSMAGAEWNHGCWLGCKPRRCSESAVVQS